MKYATPIGVVVGFMLALAIMLQGFSGFLLVLVFCAIGGLAGAEYDGLIDLRSLLRSGGRGRG